MKIWTIQPKSVWDIIEKTGRFICDNKKSDNLQDENFIRAYDWLVSKMETKIGSRPKDVIYPVWAWYLVDGKNEKPDLSDETFKYGPSGSEWVCIELEMPENQVVLTDEPSWTCFILNNDFFNNEVEEDKWDEREEWYENLPSEEKDIVRLNSWDNVFDITPFQNDFCTQGVWVQATFWEINKSNIVNVTHFTY